MANSVHLQCPLPRAKGQRLQVLLVLADVCRLASNIAAHARHVIILPDRRGAILLGSSSSNTALPFPPTMLASWRLQSTRITSCLRPSLLSRLKQSTVLVLVVFFLYTFILDHETFRRTWEYKPEADLSCPTIRLPSPIEAAVASTVWQCLTELFDTHKPTPDLERPAEFTITDAEKVTDYYTVSHALSLEPNDVEMSRKTHAALVAVLPEYPENLYTGRGIVVVGGGNYSEFAATSLGMLRHVGSELPVELWMKNDIEAQPEWCGELAAEGIACRLLSDYMDVSKLSGYQLRPAAMLLSSFQEILYLDADSNVIRNPDTLSDTKTFQERGAVL